MSLLFFKKGVSLMYCINCGSSINNNDVFCKNCGHQINPSEILHTQNDLLNNNNINLSVIIFCFLAFIFPLFGYVYWLIQKDKKPYNALTVGKWAVTGTAIHILGFVLGIVFIVILITEIAPHIDSGIDALYKFFSIF